MSVEHVYMHGPVRIRLHLNPHGEECVGVKVPEPPGQRSIPHVDEWMVLAADVTPGKPSFEWAGGFDGHLATWRAQRASEAK